MTDTDTIEATETKTPRKFKSVPFEPLWEAARRRCGNSAAMNGFSAVEFADMVGHNVKAVNRWQESGTIPLKSADRAACNLGIAAYFVWYDDWLNAYDDYDEIASGQADNDIAKAWQALDDKLIEEIELAGFGYGTDQILAEVTRWITLGISKPHERMAAYINAYA